jgi:catechol-2,3-dioxygenase
VIQSRKLGHVVLKVRDAPAKDQPGMHHMAWQVGSFDELKAAHRELKDPGFAVDAIEHNVTRSLYVMDPDGNRVELYCDMVENGFEAMPAASVGAGCWLRQPGKQ